MMEIEILAHFESERRFPSPSINGPANREVVVLRYAAVVRMNALITSAIRSAAGLHSRGGGYTAITSIPKGKRILLASQWIR